jgi:mono/diheme cytochrome c family protein
MTKPQIWVAAFLFIFLALFVIGRLTKEEETAPAGHPAQTGTSQANVSAADLTARLGCITCHGGNLTGTSMGPSLVGVGKYWSRDGLINYLRNPSANMSAERFDRYKEKYPNVIMPPFNNVDVKDLGRLADYLLQL